MGLQKTSRQHPEIGTVALRMLWIPAAVSALVAGYLVLHEPQEHVATATAAVATAHAATPSEPTRPTLDIAPQVPETSPAPYDDAVAAHQALDPVGAGRDVAR